MERSLNTEEKSNEPRGVLTGVSYFGALINLIGCFALLGMQIGMDSFAPWLIYVFAIGYPLGVLIMAAGKIKESNLSWKHPIRFVLLFLLYVILGFWDLLRIVLWIPLLVIDMLLGPLMVMICFISAAIFGLGFIENIIGYQIDGVSTPEKTMWLALGPLIISTLIIYWRYMRPEASEDPVDSWIVNLLNDAHQLIHKAIERCIQP